MKPAIAKATREASSFSYTVSKYLFLFGLAFVTFESVRPGGIMLSDYFFLLSIIFLPKARLKEIGGSGVLLASGALLTGAVLSVYFSGGWGDGAANLLKLALLFAVIAPLSLCHSKDIYRCLLFIAGGIFLNCFITVLQAFMFPGIVDALSINPPQPDVAFSGRYQGLTEYPVTLGLTAALGVLLAMGIYAVEKMKVVRWTLIFAIFICSVAALLSGSRTFFGSLIPALLMYAFLQKKQRMKTLYSILGLVLIWGSVSYVAPDVVSQFSQRVNSVGIVDYSRLAASAQALVEISQKPIFGWGADHFDEGGVVYLPETGEITGAHNTLLRYWYATGLLGAIGFLMLFIAPFRQLHKALKLRISERVANAVRLSMAATLFFFVVTNLGPYIFNRYIFIPLFIVAGFATRLVQSANAAVAAQPVPLQFPRSPIPRTTT
jgi:O-antigen ligase